MHEILYNTIISNNNIKIAGLQDIEEKFDNFYLIIKLSQALAYDMHTVCAFAIFRSFRYTVLSEVTIHSTHDAIRITILVSQCDFLTILVSQCDFFFNKMTFKTHYK